MAIALIDETKENACRTAEANAIRSKTGGTSQITYDFTNNKGFADAIAGIPTGITPTGNIQLTQQSGTDVTNYATASVRSASVSLNTPTVNSSGLVTASASVSTTGWIGSAPANKTLQLTTQAGKTVTPSASSQTAVASGRYTTGAVTVAAVPSETKTVALDMSSGNQTVSASSGKWMTSVTVNKPATLLPENIKKGITIGGVTGTLESGGGKGGDYNIVQTVDGDNCSIAITDANTFTLQNKTVTENGAVTADAGYDGLGTVTVDVQGGGGGIPKPVASNVLVTAVGSPGYIEFRPSQPRYDNLPELHFYNHINIGEQKSFTNVNGFSAYIDPYGSIGATPSDAISLMFYDVGQSEEYYYVHKDCTITAYVDCFLPDTLITLADGTKKQIKDITYSDSLKVWNFDTGEYDTAPICWLTRSGLKNGHYYKLTFSDGTILKTTGQNSNHKVYNVDEHFFKGVNKTEIGDRIFSENGIVTVANKEYIEEEVEYYNLITTGDINCFAEGILASNRYGNLYPINEEMMYIKDGRYRPYEEFEAAGINRYWYDTLRLAEVSGTIEETQQYIAKLECQMLPLPEDNT